MKKIILSLDGGGIRGIISVKVLEYLEKKIQDILDDNRARVANMVDFVAGTSTGSIIASMMLMPQDKEKNKTKKPKHNHNTVSMMTAKYSMTEIIDMYVELGGKVFEIKPWHKIKTLWGLVGPKFSEKNIEKELLKFEGHCKFGDLIKPCMICGYDIDKRRANFYTNADEKGRYRDYYVKDIVRGSTSIPSFFKPAYFKNGTDTNTIIDGGVFANNPALSAYIETSKTVFNDGIKTYDPTNVLVISLGTGSFKQKRYTYKKTNGWGKAQWIAPVIDVLLTSHSEVTDYEMNKIFASFGVSDNYKRINPPLAYASSDALDSSKENILNLLKDARGFIEANKDMLDSLAEEICDLNFFVPL